MTKLNELDLKTLKACENDSREWKNRTFKIEIDYNSEQIKVISKRKATKGKCFTVPLFEELINISNELLEKFVYSKYATNIFLHM